MLNKKILLLVIALLFTGILVYSPHFNYSLPFHHDEWTHISNVARIHEEGFSYFFNHSPVEVGFDLILLFISFFANLVAVYQFLPAINAVIVAGILFYFLKKEFNYWVALFSIIFFASLKTNANVLGLWLYVPIIGAIALDYMCLFFVEQGVKEQKPQKIYWVALLLFLIAFTHQSSFLVIFLVVLLYLGSQYKFVIKHKKYFTPFFFLLLPMLLMFVFFSNGLTDISGFFSNFIWGPLEPQINYNPFIFYGIPLSIFAALGFYITIKKEKLLPFKIYALLALINISMFHFLDFTIFSSYQRYLYHFMIASVPLSAVGFFYLITFLYKHLKKYHRIISYAVITLLILSSGILIFYEYNKIPPNAKIYRSITYDGYEALKSLKGYPPGRVLSPVKIGSTIKAITGHEPVFTYFDYKKTQEVSKFYNGDCELKEEYLRMGYLNDDINYIYAKKPQNCSFLQKLYSDKENFIYRVDLEKHNFFINKTLLFKEEKEFIKAKPDDLALNEFTFYAWIYPESKAMLWSRLLMSSFAEMSKSSGWIINIFKSRLLVQSGNLKEYQWLHGDIRLKPNIWNFIAVTYDGNFSIYINGKLDKTNESDFVYTSAPWAQMSVGSKFYLGKMKHIAFENRTLSLKEIREIYLKTK